MYILDGRLGSGKEEGPTAFYWPWLSVDHGKSLPQEENILDSPLVRRRMEVFLTNKRNRQAENEFTRSKDAPPESGLI